MKFSSKALTTFLAYHISYVLITKHFIGEHLVLRIALDINPKKLLSDAFCNHRRVRKPGELIKIKKFKNFAISSTIQILYLIRPQTHLIQTFHAKIYLFFISGGVTVRICNDASQSVPSLLKQVFLQECSFDFTDKKMLRQFETSIMKIATILTTSSTDVTVFAYVTQLW